VRRRHFTAPAAIGNALLYHSIRRKPSIGYYV